MTIPSPILISGAILAMGVTRLLCSTWQCNISGLGGNGDWTHILLHGGCSAKAKRRNEAIEDTYVSVRVESIFFKYF